MQQYYVHLNLEYVKNDIIQSVKYFNNIPGRLEKYNYKNNTIIIDYAHTPDAFANIFKSIFELKTKTRK